MNKKEIQDEILRYFYNCWETNQTGTIHSLFPILDGIPRETIEQVGEELDDLGYLTGLRQSPWGELTAPGILKVEELGLIPADKINKNAQLRYRILEAAYKVSSDASHRTATVEDMVEDEATYGTNVRANSQLLVDLGMIEFYGPFDFSILPRGKTQFESWSRKASLLEHWNSIHELRPVPRGQALQKVIAEACANAGFTTKEGHRRSNEENDVIVHIENGYYLMECKYEKDKVGAPAVGRLYSKISSRPEVRGILCSMSGFGKEVKKTILEDCHGKYIILFGPEDISQFFLNPDNIATLVNEKLHALMWDKKVIWK